MWCDEEERLDRDVRVAEVDVTKNPGNIALDSRAIPCSGKPIQYVSFRFFRQNYGNSPYFQI